MSLELVGLVSGYGATRIVQDVSLAVPGGARVAVLGRNGVGKTTLLASVVGLTRRHAGGVLLDGVDMSGLPPAARAVAGLGYVPQTRDVFRSLTVEENLRAGLKGRERRAVEEAYVMFPRLRERRRNMGGQLSGGEQQMLSMARTLLGRPRLLLLDEPLEGLAPVICDEVMETLRNLEALAAATILLVEQQVERALDFAETVFIMDRGRVAWQGSTAELRTRGDLVERYIGLGLL